MRLLIICLLFLLAFLSCGRSSREIPPPPPGILSEDQMKGILTKMALAESVINMNILNVHVTKLDSVYPLDPLRENGVRRAQFDSSVLFYIRYPPAYKKIYDGVIESLSMMQARRDSVRRTAVKSVVSRK
jgi:hypothetical protein